MTQQQKVFIKLLRDSVYSAKVRLEWAKGNVRAAERTLKKAKRDLAKWERKSR